MKNLANDQKLTRDEMKLIAGGKTPVDCMQSCLSQSSAQCTSWYGGGGISNGAYETCFQDMATSCTLGCIGYSY